MFEHDPRTADGPRECDEDPRKRDVREGDRQDPRDVFLRELDLPRGPRRERVFDRDRDYTLRGSESRTSKASVTALDSTVDAPTIVNLPAL